MCVTRSPIQNQTVEYSFKNDKLYRVSTIEVIYTDKADYLRLIYNTYIEGDITKELFSKFAREIRASKMPDGESLVPIVFIYNDGQVSIRTCAGEENAPCSYKEFDECCSKLVDNHLITDADIQPLRDEIAKLLPDFPAEIPVGLITASSARSTLDDFFEGRN